MASPASDSASNVAKPHGPVYATAKRVLRLGSVNYLNARPLIYGLEALHDASVSLDVPARLLAGLRDGRFDVALLPIIDYQRMENLRLLPAGGIGSDGPTLTVRIFSRVPVAQITDLACDPESRTSVVLARIILAERFGIHPRCGDLSHAGNQPTEARLLIGDKVVCEEPHGFEHQLDLGAAWKEMTGLPFVFAAWVARADVPLGDLAARLQHAKERGLAAAGEIVRRFAVPRGWPAELALQYLTQNLKYDIGPRQLEAIDRFFTLAASHELIDGPARPLVLA